MTIEDVNDLLKWAMDHNFRIEYVPKDGHYMMVVRVGELYAALGFPLTSVDVWNNYLQPALFAIRREAEKLGLYQ